MRTFFLSQLTLRAALTLAFVFAPLTSFAGAILSLDTPSPSRVYEVGKPILVSGKYDLSRFEAGVCTGGFFILTKVDGKALPSFNTFPDTNGQFAYYVKNPIEVGDHTFEILVARADRDGTCRGESYTVSHIKVGSSTPMIAEESVATSTPTPKPAPFESQEERVVKAPLPTISLEADTKEVAYGGSTLVRWRVSGATLCSAKGDWGGALPLSGVMESKKLFADGQFDLICFGEGGIASSTVKVPVEEAPLVTTLRADPPATTYGGTVTISWHASGAGLDCRAMGPRWQGPKSTNGHETTAALYEDTTFLYVCKNSAGETRQASITVPVLAPVSPTVSFSLSDKELSWQAAEAKTCVASGAWSGERPTTGTTTILKKNEGDVYVLTCRGEGGEAARGITIGSEQEAPTVLLSTPFSLVREGAKTVVSWEIGGGALCRGSGDWEGQVNTSGTLEVGPIFEKRVYTLTCKNTAGVTATSLVLMPSKVAYAPTAGSRAFSTSEEAALAEVIKSPLGLFLQTFLGHIFK